MTIMLYNWLCLEEVIIARVCIVFVLMTILGNSLILHFHVYIKVDEIVKASINIDFFFVLFFLLPKMGQQDHNSLSN